MLQPVQVVCDVARGGQVVVLNHCSPDQIPHSLMTDLNTVSLPKPSEPSCPTEDHSPTGKGETIILERLQNVDLLNHLMHFLLMHFSSFFFSFPEVYV